ncbi:hypothetical protein KBB96_09950 [Luteolibacter ambystomatis]|uniref:Transposase n=1 Tax=Luteolibacter ambystomatis TaxID=2824561 RepID=A0A975J354_9BACT|nr:hypothetical protein [Luteolibacter ambystomatis]QUE53203.1 hypothetical protein KBB96_09950 [Luteolibacter ambystomatis]
MSAKKSAKGKRYTPEEKQQIVDFVREANRDKGRGGVAAAVKKFAVSALTISSWVKAEGSTTPKSGKSAKAGVREGDGGRTKLLGQLFSLDQEIAMRRKELVALEAKFQKLKEQL